VGLLGKILNPYFRFLLELRNFHWNFLTRIIQVLPGRKGLFLLLKELGKGREGIFSIFTKEGLDFIKAFGQGKKLGLDFSQKAKPISHWSFIFWLIGRPLLGFKG